MGWPIITVMRWTEQLQATTDAVGALWEPTAAWALAHPAEAARNPAWAQWKTWVGAWGHFVEAAAVPPTVPLPPPLPPNVLIRPSAWNRLLAWDAQLRQWAARWRRAGVAVDLPPVPEPPPQVDPSSLGLSTSAGIGAGLFAAGVLLALYLSRR